MPNPKHLIHAHSSVVTEGEPKLPAASRIEYGEIAVNFAEGHETLSIKNSNDDIVTFSSDEKLYDVIIENERAIATALNDLNDRVDANEDSIDAIETSDANKLEKMVSLTYSQLNTKKNNAQLVPGQTYRITDYVTTTSQGNTSSANHAFDIIVTALSTTILSEDAKAAIHEGDTYFSSAGANVGAWEIKYNIKNIYWSDSSNGKGTIYHMKDENNNEAFYDFKNIIFTISSTDYYTFSILKNGVYEDASVSALYACDNIIKDYVDPILNSRKLPFNVLIADASTGNNPTYYPVYNNLIDGGCTYIKINQNSYANYFGKHCSDIEISGSDSLYFSEKCTYINVSSCSGIHFGFSCNHIDIYSSINIRFEGENAFITFGRIQPLSDKYQNCIVRMGISGSNNNPLTLEPRTNTTFQTTFVNGADTEERI